MYQQKVLYKHFGRKVVDIITNICNERNLEWIKVFFTNPRKDIIEVTLQEGCDGKKFLLTINPQDNYNYIIEEK